MQALDLFLRQGSCERYTLVWASGGYAALQIPSISEGWRNRRPFQPSQMVKLIVSGTMSYKEESMLQAKNAFCISTIIVIITFKKVGCTWPLR
jgi:hypothetical protein